MKKNSGLSLLLCLALLMQALSFPVFATVPSTQSTLPQEPNIPLATVPDTAFGTATVENGCRTIDGLIPLGGSVPFLKTAQAAFVFEVNTGTVIYAYNPDTTLSPGALTKIVAALVAIEHGNLSDQVTISTANYKTLPVGAINAKLKQDEVLTLNDLLHCLILGMANDAAITIAEHIAGSEANFVDMMNRFVKSIGCTGTVFTNCHGTNSAGQYTTARDLVRIIQYGLRNEQFKALFGATSYTVPKNEKSDERRLTTKNYLMEQLDVVKYIYEEVTGGVATYTKSSGASLACTAEKDGLSLIMVLLGCNRTYAANGYTVQYYGNFDEMWELLDFAFDKYKICRLLHEGQSWNQFTVANGENQVVGQTNVDMDVVLPVEATTKNLILKYDVEGGGLKAPIKKGDKISNLQIWYSNSCVAETELFAMSDVRDLNQSGLKIQSATRDDSNVTGVLSFIGILCLVILLLFAAYMIINNVRRAVARNRRRRRRRSRRRSR